LSPLLAGLRDTLPSIRYDYDNENQAGRGVAVSKVAALEEMYMIYQAVRNYLADKEPGGECGRKAKRCCLRKVGL
jgi:hypothetical protein